MTRVVNIGLTRGRRGVGLVRMEASYKPVHRHLAVVDDHSGRV